MNMTIVTAGVVGSKMFITEIDDIGVVAPVYWFGLGTTRIVNS